MNTFNVRGSWGNITVNADTGKVVTYTPDPPENGEYDYNNISKFDIDEWRNENPDETLEGNDLDILDLGYWTNEGVYESPDYTWRKEIKEKILS